MKKYNNLKVVFSILFFAFIQVSIGQTRKEINIPNILGYQTLKCDFHMHTVFSDGHVWPTIRVFEAWRDGLDAIAITDHINYRLPKLKDSGYLQVENHNAPYEEAKLTADKLGITLIKGVEINRDSPVGHFNVLFAEDINKLTDDDFFKALRVAKKQGAFIQWNHPWYKQKGKLQWFEVQEKLHSEGLLNGIEVHSNQFYPEVINFAKEKKLTVTANSDVHQLIDMAHDEGTYRPMTLVFAKNNTAESIKEALFERRTAAYFDNTLVGDAKYLKALFEASVEVIHLPMIVDYRERNIEFKNNSDIDFDLELVEKTQGTQMPERIHLKGNRVTLESMKLLNDNVIQADSLKAIYQVNNLKSISGEKILVEFKFLKKEPIKVIEFKSWKYPEVHY